MQSLLLDADTSEITMVGNLNGHNQSPTEIAFYLLLTTLWTLFLVSLPLFTNIGPDNYYANHPGWYTGSDVVRFIEPIGGLMLNFLVFMKSGILQKEASRSDGLCIAIFMLGGALYVQGAGFHSASVTFKNGLESIQDGQDDKGFDSLYYYMRTTWEHEVSHYVYATGYALMQAAQFWAFREVRYPKEKITFATKVLVLFSGTFLGLLVLGVALQFPAGTIVGFVYLTLYGMVAVGGYHLHLYLRKDEPEALTLWGFLVVPHHFLLGYVLSYVALILWIIVSGGFHSRSNE